MSDPVKLAIESIRFYVRNVRTRLPFKYGKAELVAAPVLHVRMRIVGEGGERVEGYSAETLPPKWFDKNPKKDFRQNVEDLLTAIRSGAACYQEAATSVSSFFRLWAVAYRRTQAVVAIKGINGLTASFSSSLFERALIDGVCKLAKTSFPTCVCRNLLGLEPEKVHPELKGRTIEGSFSCEPPDSICIRHTVGLADPVAELDIPEGERLEDGLPQSLEAWIARFGIRFFKVKVMGDLGFDLERLERISRLLDNSASPDSRVSLDGNEAFSNIDTLHNWIEVVSKRDNLRSLMNRVLYIEQPLGRSIAFHPDVTDSLRIFRHHGPVIIDESDDALGTFKTAVDLGYRGVSVKNCKGVIKGLLNKMLVDYYREVHHEDFILTGEDLMILPVVSLHQDLSTHNVLGLEHVERNGHHYCRGLDHLSEKERSDCLEHHATLYEPFDGSVRLKIRDGKIDLRSLRQSGYGSCMEPDFDSMIPLEDWSFDSLGSS